MKRIICGVVLWACASVAIAGGGPASVRKQVEMSMLVTGTVNIEPDGSVGGHAIDRADAVPEGVRTLIGQAVPKWRFEPVVIDGKPVKARSKMNLRIVAKQQVDGTYTVGIRGASFGDETPVPGIMVTSRDLSPPKFPKDAYYAGITGTVYLVIRVGREGKVEDVVVEQTNLTVVGAERVMEQGRTLLSRAALLKAKSWTFNPPDKGEWVDAPFWSVRVPVDFAFEDQKEPKYGQWRAYVPGPQQRPSWIRDEAAGSADALAAGGVYQVGQGPRLLTPLG